MNVEILWGFAMDCLCAQTRPRFASERILGNDVRTHVNFEKKTKNKEKNKNTTTLYWMLR